MSEAVILTLSITLNAAIVYLTIIVGSLAVLYSVIYLGGHTIRMRTVRARLRAGVVAAIILIVLAALDVYLAIVQLTRVMS
jgi:hypothetical protein